MIKVGEGNVDLEFMIDACLIKEFKILPSSIRNNNLDDLFYDQKKMFVEVLGNALDSTGLVKINKVFKEQQEIEKMEIKIPNSTLKIIKEQYGNKANQEIKKRQKMIKDDLIKELWEKHYGDKES